ncbi:hypothetical protein SSX86_025642 [Deinandra increscens subsp. villosa]|uniref:BTB domain-containing protein n=1 Tax=Deinandra increscens subsp. villosa TaxID=3103831 RepID=A0AAP0CJK6_9ASTR
MMCRSLPAPPTKSDEVSGHITEIYIQIVTSGGRRIPVHANILASASTVLEGIIDRPRKRRSSEKSIPILGVPCDAVEVFVGFLYSGKFVMAVKLGFSIFRSEANSFSDRKEYCWDQENNGGIHDELQPLIVGLLRTVTPFAFCHIRSQSPFFDGSFFSISRAYTVSHPAHTPVIAFHPQVTLQDHRQHSHPPEEDPEALTPLCHRKPQHQQGSHTVKQQLPVSKDIFLQKQELLHMIPRHIYTEEHMEKYSIHLLALSHVYLVPHLKSLCTKALIERLTIDNVVDALQVARLCDAPDLYLKCMKLVCNRFNSVEETEGWKFLQNHDPLLELEILQFIHENESRKKRSRRKREEQSIYFQLSEAMDCLEHICTEGCINVGPFDKEPRKNRVPCNKFSTCQGLQLSIRHFVNCKKRINGVCVRCKRMWQLFKLHASICESPACKVPLCRRFKIKGGKEPKKRKEEVRWELLVKKVVVAKATSSLLLLKRKRVEEESATTAKRNSKKI